MGAKFLDDILAYRNAGYAALYAVTPEEQRVEAALAGCADLPAVLRWSATEGWADARTGQVVRDTQDPLAALADVRELPGDGVFVLRDYHFVLDAPGVIRALKDLLPHCREEGKLLVFVSARLVLPPELEKEVTLLEVRLPDRDDLGAVLDRVLQDAGLAPESVPDRAAVIEAAVGLTQLEAENAMALAVSAYRAMNGAAVRTIHKEKCQAVRKAGLLEVIEPAEGLEAVGGLDALKAWLVQRAKAFRPEARAFGLPVPKGVLAVGVPGSGKSLAAKCVARAWNMPLLRLDLGRIFGGLVGASEANLRTALRMAEDMAPAVLWIDELEKGAAGGQASGALDSGVTARVVGSFLTWLQEKVAPVFVFATVNNVRALPPELLRKGRFDEIFWADLPGVDDRAAIFGIHLGKRGWLETLGVESKWAALNELASRSDKFVGAEIEQVVVEGLFAAYAAGRQPTRQDFLDALAATVPLAVTRADEIDAMRQWAKTRARAASSPAPTTAAPARRRLEVKR